MSKYVVKSLYLSGSGKKMWRSGDEVSPSDFKNFDELVRTGFIKEVESEYSLLDSLKKAQPLFVVSRDGQDVDIYEEKDIHKPEIVELLSKIEGLEFDEKDKKQVLWDLLISQK